MEDTPQTPVLALVDQVVTGLAIHVGRRDVPQIEPHPKRQAGQQQNHQCDESDPLERALSE